jgi:hypothetical protein
MTLNASGPLSLGGATTGQSINLELGQAATALASINATNFRTLAGVASGQISISNFYGKSNTVGTYLLIHEGFAPSYNRQFSLNNLVTKVNTSGQLVIAASMDTSVDGAGQMLNSWSMSTYANGIGATSFPYPVISNYVQLNFYKTQPYAVNLDSSGNIYVVGTANGYPIYQPTKGIIAPSVMKFNSSGTLTNGSSAYTFPNFGCGTQVSYLSVQSFGLDSSLNMYTAFNNYYYWQEGYDCCGNPIYYSNEKGGLAKWDSTFAGANFYELNYSGIRFPSPGAATDSSGGTVLVSPRGSTSYQGVVKLNSSAAVVWQRVYSTTSGAPWATLFNSGTTFGVGRQCVALDSTGASYIQTEYDQSVYMFKMSSTGTFTYAFKYLMAGFGGYAPTSIGIVTDASNNVYMYGRIVNAANSNKYAMYIIKVNSAGTVQWARLFTLLASPFLAIGNCNFNGPTLAIIDADFLALSNTLTDPTQSNRRQNILVTKYPTSGSVSSSTVNIYYPGSVTNYYTVQISAISITTTGGSYSPGDVSSSFPISVASYSATTGSVSTNTSNTSFTTTTQAF